MKNTDSWVLCLKADIIFTSLSDFIWGIFCTKCLKHISSVLKNFVGQYNIAFHSYLASNLLYQSKGSTVIFQNTGLNVGNHYNQLTGIFTAPVQGIFVFTWTITVTDESNINTELVRNMESIGAIYTSAVGVKNARTSTGVVVSDVTNGDFLYVRFSTINYGRGEIISVPSCKSTFSGWRLFWFWNVHF